MAIYPYVFLFPDPTCPRATEAEAVEAFKRRLVAKVGMQTLEKKATATIPKRPSQSHQPWKGLDSYHSFPRCGIRSCGVSGPSQHEGDLRQESQSRMRRHQPMQLRLEKTDFAGEVHS